MLSISQKLSQQQKLSPQQIQYQKLLQLNTLALEQRIKTELEMNPVLEEELELKQDQDEPVDRDDTEGDEYGENGEVEEYDPEQEFGVEDYLSDDEYYSDISYNQSNNDENKVYPVTPARESLSEHLYEQIAMLRLPEAQRTLGEEIIGNLDADGYLTRSLEEITSELNMFEHVAITAAEAESVLKKIQLFDPIGIASRSLKECLIIQLKHSGHDPYYTYLADELLTEHFEDFVQKRYDSIMEKMDVNRDTLLHVIELIQRLNPKPGEGSFEEVQSNQISPDFIIEKMDDDYTITLNDRALPSVTINKTYLEMLQQNKRKRKANPREKNTYKFLREKFESARWFIACIEQRRETLMKVMRSIFERQYEFFEFGPKHLKPMIYKDVADEIGMDISTISRVVNGKFVQSPMGIHELKYFFSEGLATDSGEEVSNKHIKERIKEIIEGESKRKPLSDDKIGKMLNEEGIHIARRTVAKYREQLRLPVARLRKEL